MFEKQKITMQKKIIKRLETENQSLLAEAMNNQMIYESAKTMVTELEAYITEYKRLLSEVKEIKFKYNKARKELDAVKNGFLRALNK